MSKPKPNEPPLAEQFAKLRQFQAQGRACGMDGENLATFANAKLAEWVRDYEDRAAEALLTPLLRPEKKPRPEVRLDAKTDPEALRASLRQMVAREAESPVVRAAPEFDESEAPVDEGAWHEGMDIPF